MSVIYNEPFIVDVTKHHCGIFSEEGIKRTNRTYCPITAALLGIKEIMSATVIEEYISLSLTIPTEPPILNTSELPVTYDSFNLGTVVLNNSKELVEYVSNYKNGKYCPIKLKIDVKNKKASISKGKKHGN